MLNIPTPTLSQVYAFTITSPDLETSSAFYQKLGFKELFRSDFPFPLILISDGSIQIMLRKDPTPYIALSYYVADIEKTVADLEQNGLTFTQKPAEKDLVKRAIFHTPDGATLSLVGFTEGIPQPAGATLLNTAPSDYANTAKYTNQSLGLFGEYAFSVADLGQSIQFWEKLGFAVLHKTDAPRTWAILSDGLAITGLHQGGGFSKPRITYFASDSDVKIEQLKALGISDFTENSTSRNATIRTPEQQEINLFKLGF